MDSILYQNFKSISYRELLKSFEKLPQNDVFSAFFSTGVRFADNSVRTSGRIDSKIRCCPSQINSASIHV